MKKFFVSLALVLAMSTGAFAKGGASAGHASASHASSHTSVSHAAAPAAKATATPVAKASAPVVSTKAAPVATKSITPATKPVAPKAASAKVGAVDINTATEAELRTIPGIGPAYAQKIIKNRPYNGSNEVVTKAGVPKGVYAKVKNNLIAKKSANAPKVFKGHSSAKKVAKKK